jgi:hypothetical protein
MSGRRVAIAIAALGLIVAWYYLGYTPSNLARQNLQDQIRSCETQLEDYKTTIAQVPVLIHASNEMNTRKARQASVLFGKSDILRMFSQLRAVAADERMVVTEITPPVSELLTLNTAAENPGDPLFLNISVQVRGDYVGFGRFVERLEQLPYFCGTNTCSAHGALDKSEPVVYTVGFKALLSSLGGKV